MIGDHMKKYSAILLVLFFPYFSLAQIVIEERVEIEPTNQQIISDNPTFSQTLQLDVQWNQPQYDAAIVSVNVPCQMRRWLAKWWHNISYN